MSEKRPLNLVPSATLDEKRAQKGSERLKNPKRDSKEAEKAEKWSAEADLIRSTKPVAYSKWGRAHMAQAETLLEHGEADDALWHIDQAARVERQRQMPIIPTGPPKEALIKCKGCGLGILDPSCRCAEQILKEAMAGEALGLITWRHSKWQ